MKAINGNVFIKPDNAEEHGFSVEVSENALTRSYKGVVLFCEEDKNVTIGDEVLIPHYGVLDIEYDGQEIALTKVSKLFAKRKGDSYTPINQYVKIRKCANDHIRDESGEIALHMTDNHIETTNWVEILDVSDECKKMRKEYIGMFCVAPEDSENLCRIGYTKDFCLHEDEIAFVTNGE